MNEPEKAGKHNNKLNTWDVCLSNLGTKECEKKQFISIFAPFKISLQH